MRQRTRHIMIGLIVAAAAIAAAALASILPREVSPPPGANAPPLLTEGDTAPVSGRNMSVEDESVMNQFESEAGDSVVPLNVAAFDECPKTALEALRARVQAAVGQRTSRGPVSTPSRPIVEYKGRYPYRIDATEYIGFEPTPIYLLPSPTTARAAMKDFLSVQAPHAQSLGEQADAIS